MDKEKFPSRLKAIREERGLSQERLAAMIGVTRVTIQNYERGDTEPKTGIARKLAEALDCDGFWLFKGEEGSHLANRLKESTGNVSRLLKTMGGPILDAARKTIAMADEQGWPLEEPETYAYVPVIKGQLAAGGGIVIEADAGEVIDYVAFKRDWLYRLGRPKDFKIMAARGDSMEPVISDNDLILFDVSRKDPRPGKIYAIAFDGHIYVKRLFAEPGRLVLRSENTAHTDIVIDLHDEHQANTVQVLGRVIWWCHTEAV